MRLRHFIPLLLLITIIVLAAPSQSQAQQGDSCEQIINAALDALGTTRCISADPNVGMGPNSACYVYQKISASVFPGEPTPDDFFAQPGYSTKLTSVNSVTSSGLDLAQGFWGVGMFNVQADIPTPVGENALYLLFGDVQITNVVPPDEALIPVDPIPVTTTTATDLRQVANSGASAVVKGLPAGTALQADGISADGEWLRVTYEQRAAWVSLAALDTVDTSGLPVIDGDTYSPMQAFTLRTGADNLTCTAALPSMLVVQSPQNTPIIIVANGVKIQVDGTIFLRTLPNNLMELMTLTGEAAVYPGQPGKVSVPAGTGVKIPMDGGGWSEWRVYPADEWQKYEELVRLPDRIWRRTVTVPIIIPPSGVGEVTYEIIEVEERYYVVTRVEPGFPRIELITGETGRDLERETWAPFSIGCRVCDPELVLYHSNGDRDWDIYRLDEVTRQSLPENNVTRGPQTADIQPSFSADEEWFAYTTNRDRLLSGSWEIYVGKTDGTRQVRVTFNSGADVNPVWGPKNLIAFESNRDANWDLYMFDVEGDGIPVRLTDDPANDINAYWAPDGGCEVPGPQWLVFQSDRDGGDWDIFKLNVETMELTQLTENDVEDQVPVLSPDGRTMAWVQEDEFGVYNLWLMDLVTMETRQLTDTKADIAGHTFSPSGSFLAYHSNIDGDLDVFVVDKESGLIKRLTENDVEDEAPSFRCDDRELIYHAETLVENAKPLQRELYEVDPLPLDGPPNDAIRLTVDEIAEDMFPLADPQEEINSKEGRAPEHP